MKNKRFFIYFLVIILFLLIFKHGVFAENILFAKSEKELIKKGSIALDKEYDNYIKAEDGSTTCITIPKGSLDRNVVFNLSRDNTFNVIAYRFDMKDINNGKTLYDFAKPVNISINYTITNGKVTNTNVLESEAASKLAIYYFDGFKWMPVNSIINVNNKTISTTTIKCFIFAVEENTTDKNTIYACPNPFTPNGDGINDIISFYYNEKSITGNVLLKIFEKSGRQVRTITTSNNLSWDGKDGSGEIVKSGVYIYQITINSNIYSGTIILAK